jgi:hypothetical protein
MALQFEHIFPNGSYNMDTWHDGCNVVSGTKITLQKFKELPLEQRQPGDQVQNPTSRLLCSRVHGRFRTAICTSASMSPQQMSRIETVWYIIFRAYTKSTTAYTVDTNCSQCATQPGIQMSVMTLSLSAPQRVAEQLVQALGLSRRTKTIFI